jgi:hypothetical protein
MIKKIMLYILIFLSLAFLFFFVGKPSVSEDIVWGVNFSHKHAELLGLNWREAYLVLIDDMEVKNIKLATYWDLIEKEQGNYNFEDLDWQIETAQEKGVKLLLTIGMKAPRWPECHLPNWAESMGKEAQQERILALIEKIVSRYSLSPAIAMWQVENEPFFPFGQCQWTDNNFLKKEIALVKYLDSLERPVVISDSGEGSFWIQAARFGDIIGTTMYRKVWFRQLEAYVSYPFPPVFYARKAKIIKELFDKKVINVELQAEPWGPKLLYDSPLSEQEKTMNLEQFRKNIEFAQRTGFDEFYLWGAEWWYWMKEKQNQPEIWQEAKKLF